jgi:radical SAM superfamily enzyme YgiQ (UPF0313 family)
MHQNVLFLVPPLIPILRDDLDIRGGRDSYRARYPHLGLAYMCAVLRTSDITYKVLDMNLGYSLDQVLDEIKSCSPDFICITVYSAGYKIVYSLVNSLKTRYGGIIVLGGPHISIIGGQALEMTTADFAIAGEGEYALADLVHNLEPQTVKGLIWRRDSQIIENEKRELLNDLDSLPYPAFEDFEIDKYLCFLDKRLPIITSRGCPFRCIYCCTPLSMGHGFRARSPENVVDEICYWYEKGWNVFDINDDVFTFKRERARRVCELLLERKLKITFNLAVGIRANSVDEELLRVLKEAGCRFISYGCEAGSDRILQAIKKGIKTKDVENAVKLTRKVGINHKVNFIIGHPMEGYSDALESAKLAKRLKCNFVGFNNLIPYPGTEAYSLIDSNPHARFLYPPDVYLNDLTHKKLMPVFETDKFTVEQMRKVLMKGFDLEEKTLACFRFGLCKGYFVYLLERNKYIWKQSRRLFDCIISTKIGSTIYRFLVKSPW